MLETSTIVGSRYWKWVWSHWTLLCSVITLDTPVQNSRDWVSFFLPLCSRTNLGDVLEFLLQSFTHSIWFCLFCEVSLFVTCHSLGCACGLQVISRQYSVVQAPMIFLLYYKVRAAFWTMNKLIVSARSLYFWFRRWYYWGAVSSFK